MLSGINIFTSNPLLYLSFNDLFILRALYTALAYGDRFTDNIVKMRVELFGRNANHSYSVRL